MSNNNGGRALVEALGYGVSAALICRALAMVPVLNFILLLLPSPFAVLLVCRGRWWGVVSMGVAAVVLWLVGGTAWVLAFVALSLPTAIILAWYFQRKADAFYAALMSAIAAAAAEIILIQAIKWFTGMDIFGYVQRIMEALFKDTALNSDVLGLIQPQPGSQVSPADMAAAFTDIFKMILPSMVMISALIIGFANMLVAGRWLKRYGLDISEIEPFYDWRLPKDAAKGLLGIALAGLLGMIFGISGFDLVFATILGVLNFIFAMQGLATIDYIMVKSNVKPIWRVLLMIFNFIVFQLMLAILGIAEQIFHIRRGIDDRYSGGGMDT